MIRHYKGCTSKYPEKIVGEPQITDTIVMAGLRIIQCVDCGAYERIWKPDFTMWIRGRLCGIEGGMEPSGFCTEWVEALDDADGPFMAWADNFVQPVIETFSQGEFLAIAEVVHDYARWEARLYVYSWMEHRPDLDSNYDPTRWCNDCGAQRQEDCKCPPLPSND